MNHPDRPLASLDRAITMTTQPLDHDDDAAETSPESAAVARGAARTAAASAGGKASSAASSVTRGAVAGRLPMQSAAKASSGAVARPPKIPAVPRAVPRSVPKSVSRGAHRGMPRPPTPRPAAAPRPTPRSVPRPSRAPRIPKARANTIARASDRASMGIDVLSAGLEQNESSESDRKKSKATAMTTVKDAVQRFASFGKIFVANTVLGMAVFAAYEGMIERMAPSIHEGDPVGDSAHNNHISDDASCDNDDGIDANPSQNQMQTHDVGESVDSMDRATLPQHFLAGAMGGSAHAMLSLALDMKFERASSVAGQQVSRGPIRLQAPSLRYSAASILHHSAAHSVLFGSYQMTKRLLLPSDSRHSTALIDDAYYDKMHVVASIAAAGGLAGQFQHVASHLTEQWLGLSEVEAAGRIKSNATLPSSLFRQLTSATFPTWRSTMLAFAPSAIGFLAFEYGKLIIAGDDLANADH